MITEKQGEQAFDLNKKIADNELQRRTLLGQNIKLLKQIKEDNLYKAMLGDDKAEWVAYLGQIEVFYSRNEIYNWFRIDDKFSELGYKIEDICDIPVSRLVTLIAMINQSNIEDLLGSARTLTRRDFENVLRELKGLPTTENCEHDYKKVEECRICGEKHAIT